MTKVRKSTRIHSRNLKNGSTPTNLSSDVIDRNFSVSRLNKRKVKKESGVHSYQKRYFTSSRREKSKRFVQKATKQPVSFGMVGTKKWMEGILDEINEPGVLTWENIRDWVISHPAFFNASKKNPEPQQVLQDSKVKEEVKPEIESDESHSETDFDSDDTLFEIVHQRFRVRVPRPRPRPKPEPIETPFEIIDTNENMISNEEFLYIEPVTPSRTSSFDNMEQRMNFFLLEPPSIHSNADYSADDESDAVAEEQEENKEIVSCNPSHMEFEIARQIGEALEEDELVKFESKDEDSESRSLPDLKQDDIATDDVQEDNNGEEDEDEEDEEDGDEGEDNDSSKEINSLFKEEFLVSTDFIIKRPSIIPCNCQIQ